MQHRIFAPEYEHRKSDQTLLESREGVSKQFAEMLLQLSLEFIKHRGKVGACHKGNSLFRDLKTWLIVGYVFIFSE